MVFSTDPAAVPKSPWVSSCCLNSCSLVDWFADAAVAAVADADDVANEDDVATVDEVVPAASAFAVMLARHESRLGVAGGLMGSPNSPPTFANSVASRLNWTMSLTGALCSADVTFGDDNSVSPSLERVCSKLATPGFTEDTEPMFWLHLYLYIGSSGAFSSLFGDIFLECAKDEDKYRLVSVGW